MRADRVLLYARRRKGLSQRELAERAGVPQSTVARIESGAIDPRVRTLDRLLRACDEQLEAMPRIGIGVDRTLARERLKAAVNDRLDDNARAAAFVAELRRARKAASDALG